MTQILDQYQRLIEQAYIDPIRSVVVVDDDFPTLDALLESVKSLENSSSEPSAAPIASPDSRVGNDARDLGFKFSGHKHEVDRAAALIKACRGREKPWAVDIHDGSASDGIDELALAPSLHHTDLMILDFHLNGDTGNGERAIDILRALAKNSQFNLVVVYTKGISGNLFEVFQQIVTGLLFGGWGSGLPQEKFEQLQERLQEWQEDSGEDPFPILLERISIDTYLKHRANEKPYEVDRLHTVFEELLQRIPSTLRDAPIVYEIGEKQYTDSADSKLKCNTCHPVRSADAPTLPFQPLQPTAARRPSHHCQPEAAELQRAGHRKATSALTGHHQPGAGAQRPSIGPSIGLWQR